MHMSTSVPYPLELELKAVVSHLTWVLGIELRSPGMSST